MAVIVENTITRMFSDRGGGVSTGVYGTGNLSRWVGDDETSVAANRQRLKDRLAARVLISARQVHGEQVLLIDEDCQYDQEFAGYDALITRQKKMALMVQLADCQGLLLFDPKSATIAAVHCGWRGNVANIIGKTIAQMGNDAGSQATDIQAWISPSLGPCCAEFVDYKTIFPPPLWGFQTRDNYFDLWQMSTWQLKEAGVPGAQITPPAICTCCTRDYFSYRRANREQDGLTGRQGAAIMLA